MEYRRLYQPGARYFFTVVTANRKPILIDQIQRLRDAFRLCLYRYPFEIDAIVVLPDHLHTLWKLPDGDADFSRRWMVIKRKFSSGLPQGKVRSSMAQKREKGIWQRRFWEHCIRDEEDWRRHMDYIHFNPVKHGLVSAPHDWQYSSYPQAIRRGWYEINALSEDDVKNCNYECPSLELVLYTEDLVRVASQLNKADPNAANKEMRTFGTLGVLRHEVRDRGTRFRLSQKFI